jgi:thioredoxin reductase (NADPH)
VPNLGAKVAVLYFVKPSPAGSTWGLGGTCVNVGCIPKKLMHTASIIGETLKDDAAAFGWKDSAAGAHDWESMKSTVQDHIKSLNFKYRVALREAGITYLNRLGEFEDKNTISLTDKKGNKTSVTAARFIVAVGGRPNKLGCPGGEHAIDSDDLFSLPKAPGRVLCVGGGYIALECGGFTAGMGYPTTCMVRSILLRGFDRECVGKIEAHIKHHGVQLQVGVTPAKIEKDAATGVLTVTDSGGGVHEYDTVLVATGRYADTAALGIDNVPGASANVNAKTKKLECVDEQLPGAPHVYAIGDVVEGRPELTPVAIEAGLRLARRLFGGKTEPMDYECVATTIFTPLEYGTIGLSEDDAKAQLGECNVESYISEFAPLEYALSETRSERGDGCFAKLVVDKSTGKVVGFHYLGPNAGEITQGFSIAMRKGATYADFISTVGIHPTVAEEFTSMTVTKSSGESAAKGGC